MRKLKNIYIYTQKTEVLIIITDTNGDINVFW